MDDQYFKELGRYLKDRRIRVGVTQIEMGRLLEYRAQFVANWERGASAPLPHALRKIIETFGMS